MSQQLTSDNELLAHIPSLLDAETQGNVLEDTELVILHRPPRNTRLYDLTAHITGVKFLVCFCQEDGSKIPSPAPGEKQKHVRLLARFVQMVFLSPLSTAALK